MHVSICAFASFDFKLISPTTKKNPETFQPNYVYNSIAKHGQSDWTRYLKSKKIFIVQKRKRIEQNNNNCMEIDRDSVDILFLHSGSK